MSNISRVEAKRETFPIQAVLKNINFDDYQRPKTQDQTINYQTKHVDFEKTRKHNPNNGFLKSKRFPFFCGGQCPRPGAFAIESL